MLVQALSNAPENDQQDLHYAGVRHGVSCLTAAVRRRYVIGETLMAATKPIWTFGLHYLDTKQHVPVSTSSFRAD